MSAGNGAHSNAAPPQLVSLRGGLQTIVDALLQRVGGALHLSSEVTELSREREAWALTFADGSRAQTDAVVCALPAYASARLVRSLDAELAAMLESIRYNSIATVNLAYDAATLPPLPPAPGFVVPFIERRRITAATIATQKYPDRSPKDGVLLRAFIGGALQPELVERPDAELADMAREEFSQLLGVTAEPRFALVRRWMRMLPEYGVGHPQLISAIEDRTAALGGLALAGSALRGVGIPDCVASGIEAAERLAQGSKPAKSG
jgi:oxygen-dependent protoporphyrinogen oxidase